MIVLDKKIIKDRANAKESVFNEKKNKQMSDYKRQRMELQNELNNIEITRKCCIEKELDKVLDNYDYYLSYHINYICDRHHCELSFKPKYDIYSERNFNYTLFITVKDDKTTMVLNVEVGTVEDIESYVKVGKVIDTLNKLDWCTLTKVDNVPKYSDFVTISNPYIYDEKPNFIKEVYSDIFDYALETGESVKFENPEYLDNDFVSDTKERYVVGKSGNEYYLQSYVQKLNKVPFVEIFDVSKIEDISFLRYK